MKLPAHERASHREAFKAMSATEKLDYILSYYKLPLVIALIVVVALVSALRVRLAHKDVTLYVAYANVSLPETLDELLASEFMQRQGQDLRTHEVYRYFDLYISEAEQSIDHQYSYASRLKLMAAVEGQQLDVVLMNKAAYDLLSASGYLMDLDEALSSRPELASLLTGKLCRNTVVLADNRLELDLGEAETYEAQTLDVTNALNVTSLLAQDYEFTDELYLAVLVNTARADTAFDFIAYLCER